MTCFNPLGCSVCSPKPSYFPTWYEVRVNNNPTYAESTTVEESIDLSYEQRVVDLADELARQFDGLSISDALLRANQIIQSAEEVEAMYLGIMEDVQ